MPDFTTHLATNPIGSQWLEPDGSSQTPEVMQSPSGDGSCLPTAHNIVIKNGTMAGFWAPINGLGLWLVDASWWRGRFVDDCSRQATLSAHSYATLFGGAGWLG